MRKLLTSALAAVTAAAAVAAVAASFFQFGRQVEQTAPHWRPGLRLRLTWAAARQAGYPAIATAGASLLAAILAGGA